MAGPLRPISMREAVGYDDLEHLREESIEERIVLKHDRLFLLATRTGDITPPGGGALGLFHDDTRVLSHYQLRLGAGSLSVLSSQIPAPYLAQIDLAVSDRTLGGNTWDPKSVLHIRRELLLDDCLIERLTLTNYLTHTLECPLELQVGCDFADIFEVRGWQRSSRGQFFAPDVAHDNIIYHYRDMAGTMLATALHFQPQPGELEARVARWLVRLEPGHSRVLEWRVHAEPAPGRAGVATSAIDPAQHAANAVSPANTASSTNAVSPAQVDSADPPANSAIRVPRCADPALPFDERRLPLAHSYEQWRADCTGWDTDVEQFNATLDQAINDLRSLYIPADGQHVISAGIPWYSTVFGRDSIIASFQTLPLNPRIAVDTLKYLARHQGRRENPYTEEQPGRIMHELRRGELARSGEIPHTPYYGTIDATPLFLVLLHETWRWTGDDALARALLPAAMRALEWIDRYGDIDGDGFVEYARTSERGLVNQGWRDSGDGVPFPDGTLPEPPIALVEVQGYVLDAKFRMAQLLQQLGDPDTASRLRDEAELLRRRISGAFWLEDLGAFALALDGRKRPLPTITSNAGHLLWSRAATRAQAASLARHLLGDSMFCGWGIRTLSAEHAVFNPMSYHNGSVWPHDNAIVVTGLAHYGFGRDALPILRGLHDATIAMNQQRPPELFCGMQRTPGSRPVLYPVSCSPQAWASGAFFMLLQAVLGILPDAPRHAIYIREPHLPDFLQRLTISDLRVGNSSVGFEFRRKGERTLAYLTGVSGEPLRVLMELA